ncbi:MAG: tRNA (adenine(22)-N(1))-methyltransferase TrmK [Fibrobacterales bacterium]
MREQLGERLYAAYSNLRPRWDVWDFCCDHGYLGKKALENNKFNTIHFVDRVYHITEELTAYLVDHDNALVYNEDIRQKNLYVTGNLVFFGIGAQSIIDMLLLQCPQPIEGVRLILCPNKNPETLRTYLASGNWKIVTDTLIEDNRSLKEVIVCEAQGETIELFGNYLKNHPQYSDYIRSRKEYYESLPEENSGRKEFLPYLIQCVTAMNTHQEPSNETD